VLSSKEKPEEEKQTEKVDWKDYKISKGKYRLAKMV
jgi:hypothetical protein